jgi:hypothetical protein
MKSSILRSCLVAFLFAAVPAFAVEAPKEDAAASAKLLAALKNADREAFVVDGEAAFKQLSQPQFAAAAAQLSPRLKGGYEVAYLGDLKQHGYRVTLWKLSFKDGGDDVLATLSMKDGKVGGFWVK